LQVRRFRSPDEFLGDAIYDLSQPLPDSFTIVDPVDQTRRKHFAATHMAEDLLIPIFRHGELIYQTPPLTSVRDRAAQQLAMLHPGIKRSVHPHQYPAGLELSLPQSQDQTHPRDTQGKRSPCWCLMIVPEGRQAIAHDFNRGFPHSKPTSPVGTADAAHDRRPKIIKRPKPNCLSQSGGFGGCHPKSSFRNAIFIFSVAYADLQIVGRFQAAKEKPRSRGGIVSPLADISSRILGGSLLFIWSSSRS